jgi:hypothetical protein
MTFVLRQVLTAVADLLVLEVDQQVVRRLVGGELVDPHSRKAISMQIK